MKIIIKNIVFIYLLVCVNAASVFAQQPVLISSIAISKPESVSIDRFNNIYITDAKGTISKYDPNGKFLLNYSPTRPAKINLLEAWQAIRIFAFSQDLQQIQFLDRFLIPAPIIKLQDLNVGFIKAATIGIDNNIWLVDDSDLSLKKYNVLQQKITINSPLNLQLNNSSFEINFIKEYQNHLFINDVKNGILVFDILGNYLKTLPIKEVKYFNFLNDELYYLKEDKVIFYNFYRLIQRSIDIPFGPNYVLATDTKLFCISDKQLGIYTW